MFKGNCSGPHSSNCPGLIQSLWWHHYHPLPLRTKENEEGGLRESREKAWMRQSGKAKERSTEGIPETFPPSEQNWYEFESNK